VNQLLSFGVVSGVGRVMSEIDGSNIPQGEWEALCQFVNIRFAIASPTETRLFRKSILCTRGGYAYLHKLLGGTGVIRHTARFFCSMSAKFKFGVFVSRDAMPAW